MLAGGWRVEINPYQTRELIARLVEATLEAVEDSNDLYKRVEEAIEESEKQSAAAERNDAYFRELCRMVWDLQEGQKWVEKVMKIKGLVREAKKKGDWEYPEGLHLHPKSKPEKERAWDVRDEIWKRKLGNW